jgi:hypothetical protein
VMLLGVRCRRQSKNSCAADQAPGSLVWVGDFVCLPYVITSALG